MDHELDGLINSTKGHGRTAPCACEHPANPPPDMPRECQCELLRDVWVPDWDALDRSERARNKTRFRLYQTWARNLGIRRIRVQPPPCVRALITAEFGASSTGFNPGINSCACATDGGVGGTARAAPCSIVV